MMSYPQRQQYWQQKDAVNMICW